MFGAYRSEFSLPSVSSSCEIAIVKLPPIAISAYISISSDEQASGSPPQRSMYVQVPANVPATDEPCVLVLHTCRGTYSPTASYRGYIEIVGRPVRCGAALRCTVRLGTVLRWERGRDFAGSVLSWDGN